MCLCVCDIILRGSLTRLQAFLSEADGVMSGLLRLYTRMKQEYQKAIRFFGEDISKMRIDEFFGTFAAFVTDFEVCRGV